ncbi:MAG: acetoacetate--CoA ligase [Microthrixaceae bacterium]
MSDDPLWTPSPDVATSCAMGRLIDESGLDGYPALHRWSVEHPDRFWAEVWDRCGVLGDRGTVILDGSGGVDWTDVRFFPDARLNVAENILDGRGADDDTMFVEVGEPRDGGTTPVVREFTRGEVRREVAAFARALTGVGVAAGDRVAAWMPNVAETAIAMLGAAAIGAVFVSTSPDFGVDGVLDRFGQVEPVVLVVADGYRYGGKRLDCLDRLEAIRPELASLRRVVLVGDLDGRGAPPQGVDRIADARSWDDFVGPHRGGALASFERFGFDHPWYVLFSSGTTGVPKCIVHRAGGVLLQHLKEHQFHCDIRRGDRVAYYTTCGWMMWNWLMSVPASGAAAVLYDGSPFHPGPEVLPSLVDRLGITFLGISAKYLDSLRKAGVCAREVAPMPTLRSMASTGSPLSPETNEWAVRTWPEGTHLASISGGTDLCSCFVLGDPTSPAYPGELQRPGLGMAVEVVGPDGTPVGVGERGELVCTRPFPSRPLGFWGDDDGSRYRGAYFDKWPGVWAHGDFASWTPHGGMVLHGRSDTTLNPGGVRIGTAEIYRRVEEIPEVVESLVFGQEVDDDTRIVLLVRLADGATLDDDLVERVKRTIRLGCTPRHVPAVVAAVADLPRTRSGKLAELAVSDAVNGRPVRNTSALANAEVLDDIAALAALRV